MGLPQVWGCEDQKGIFVFVSDGDGHVARIGRLVQIGTEPSVDIMTINRSTR
jgi:hypothetical protein